MVFARLAFVASVLFAVLTEGGLSEPGSARFTISASWLGFVIARLAKVKVRDWDAPLPASPNTEPLKSTPPLSVVLLPAPCRKSVVKVAPTPWPVSWTLVRGTRSALAGAAARPAARAAAARAMDLKVIRFSGER